MRITRAPLVALAGLALVAAVTAVSSGPQDTPEPDPSVPTTADPDAVWDVLVARPFRVGEPFIHWWRAERPAVTAGHLLVLAVDPQKFVPRQELEPVLQVGEETAERVNAGHLDGTLVVIVPSPAGLDGWPTRDLTLDPIFLGTPALPERVDSAHLVKELVATTAMPFGAARIERALANGGAPLDARDRNELEQEAARLIQAYAPSEQDRAAGLLVPFER